MIQTPADTKTDRDREISQTSLVAADQAVEDFAEAGEAAWVERLMSDMQIEYWPREKLVPYAKNPRRNDGAVDRMCGSIREYGFKIPVLARSDGEVVDGHLRLKAAGKLGINRIPVIRCDDWTDAQVKGFRLMVHNSVTWAEWDEELLAEEMAALNELDFDLTLTGFDSGQIDKILADPGGEDADRTLPPAEVAISRRGDLWLLGRHRVLCGDATQQEDVARVLSVPKPLLMVTDPPYGVNYDPEWREVAGLNPRTRQSGSVENDDRVDWSAAWSLFPGDIAYVWHAGVFASGVAVSLASVELAIRAQIIWVKQHFAISRGAYHWQHEPCWYAVRRGKSANWKGDRKQSTVWEVANLNPMGGSHDEPATGHGTQKPVEVMRRPIVNHTNRGDAVYDPFLGSGTTVMAAEILGRLCCGIDIDPIYVDMTVRRWEKYTGQAAILDGDGRSYAQITNLRQEQAARGTAQDPQSCRTQEHSASIETPRA